MRLRTLPLSLSGIVMGIFLAAADYRIDALTVIFLALTTVCPTSWETPCTAPTLPRGRAYGIPFRTGT